MFNKSFRLIVHTSQVTLFHWIHSSLLLAFLHGNNLPLDRLVESCGTSRLKLLQLGFANLNSVVFNIDVFVADLPGDNVDKIRALEDLKEMHTRLQLVSDGIPPVIVVGLYSLLCGGLLRIRWLFHVSNVICQSRTNMYRHVQCPAAMSMLVQRNTNYSPWIKTVPHKCCVNVQQHRNRASFD